MIDQLAKEYLRADLKSARAVLLHKVDGLSEYDIRRPLTPTGTNLLGLVKHLTLWESRYLVEVFDRPYPEPMPRWDDHDANRDSLWVAEHETTAEVVDQYRRVWRHSAETIDELPIDAPGHVPWWPRPNVTLFNVMVHTLTETSRHAGHADILREQLDGAVGDGPAEPHHDNAYWQDHRSRIEQAARSLDCGDRGRKATAPGVRDA